MDKRRRVPGLCCQGRRIDTTSYHHAIQRVFTRRRGNSGEALTLDVQLFNLAWMNYIGPVILRLLQEFLSCVNWIQMAIERASAQSSNVIWEKQARWVAHS